MTRRDILEVFHEPFGDAFYFGPEKISPAHLRWPAGKIEKSGRIHYTYDHVLQGVLHAMKVIPFQSESLRGSYDNVFQEPSKRVLIKDMAYHIIAPIHSIGVKPRSLQHLFAKDDAPNPTLFPTTILQKFQVVFLIRKPSSSIPSLYRCFIPPLSDQTDEHLLDPTELGYREMRILLDHLYPSAGQSLDAPLTKSDRGDEPLLIDADDFLAQPDTTIRSLCTALSIRYSPSMLHWDSPDDHAYASSLFEKYAGYHQDALNSTGLYSKPAPAQGPRMRSRQEEDQEWRSKYGDDAARMIREVVDQCQEDYEYLKQFRYSP
ncbi:MAG: hypothetical protein Q9218_006263 [Villophora microphyllina]